MKPSPSISVRAIFAVLLFGYLGSNLWAKNKKAGEAIIVEMSPLEMSVSRGHEVHVTYQIPKSPIVTFDGLPASVADLRAGMMVTVRPDATGKIALAIRAHNAPRH